MAWTKYLPEQQGHIGDGRNNELCLKHSICEGAAEGELTQ